MKTRKLLSALVAASICAGALSNVVMAASPLSMSIDTGTVIKTISDDMYGISTDWSVDNNYIVTDYEGGDLSPNENFLRAMSEYKLPVVRLGEGASDTFQWKQAVGPLEQRGDQTLWGQTGKVAAGPVETINTMQAIDPDAEFTVTINMQTDTAASAADYAEFLTGDISTDWGAKRAEYGHPAPIPVKVYELGNELDLDDMTVQDYIAKCKEFITAIQAKDPDAKFAAHTTTGIYNMYRQNESLEDAWHNDILNDDTLAQEIDYIVLHTYYSVSDNELMDEIINAVQSDIERITGSDRIKIYLSEYALDYYHRYNGIYTNPHDMNGVIETANILSRMAWHPGVEMATYHGIVSGNWANITTDSESQQTMLNGIGNLLKLFKEYGVGDALDTDFTGFSNGTRSTVTGIAVRPENNKLNLIFTNKTESDQVDHITYSDQGAYKKVQETIISADTLEADISEEKKEIAVNKYAYADGGSVVSYTIPAYSVCGVALEKETDETVETLYSEDFSAGTLPEGYTAVLNDPYGDLSVNVQNGALALDGYSDSGATYENSYVYLPESVNTFTSYTLEADVTVNEYTNDYDPGESGNGIVFGAGSPGNIMGNAVDGNVVFWTDNGVSEYAVSGGERSTLISNTTNNFSPIITGETYHYTLNVSENEVSFYIDGKEVYTRTGGTVNPGGYIGFMFSDTNYSVDNIQLTQAVEVMEVWETFTYEENFDDVSEGSLPEGWEVMSGMAVAGVDDGALMLTSHEWWTPTAVKIGGLENVRREGLMMEADVTLIAQNESARAGGVRNKAGFAYMMDGDRMSTAGLLTYGINQEIPARSGADFTEYGVSGVNSSSGFNYEDGENFLNHETAHIRLVFSAGSSPTMYVNGQEVQYTKNTGTTQNTGSLGLMAAAATVKFDNVKITGQQRNTVTTGLVEKEIDFTYEENFDDVSDGLLPAGWTLAGATATAQVKNGALEVSNAGWGTPSFVLFDLDQVKRQGLTMEVEITRTSPSSVTGGLVNIAHAGLVYLYDDSFAETAAYGTDVRYSGLYTDRPTTNSQQGVPSDFGYKYSQFTSEEFKRADLFGNQGDGLSGGQTVKLKIELGEDNRLPKVYINDVEANYTSNNAYEAMDVNEGKIGLVVADANVKFDNIKVHGTRTAFVSDYTTYSAEFAGGATTFASQEEAVAAVRVYEVYDAGRVDITDQAQISAQTDEMGVCTITVTYGEFMQHLVCQIKEEQTGGQSFTLEEDFDDIPNGSLPEGWTVTGGDATAQVNNGALEVSNAAWGTPSYILFDLDEVQRHGLTMEAEITRTAASSGMANYGHAGLVYLYDDQFTETQAYGTDVRYSALYTDKPATESQQGAPSDFGAKFQNLTGESFRRADLFGNQGEGLSGGNTVTLKIELDEDTRLPKVYINGVEAPYATNNTYSALAVNAGKIGLVVCDATVKFDNIKVSGTIGGPAEEITYDALFVDGISMFTSEEEAVAAVRVYEMQGGQTLDVTVEANIQAQTDENGNCTITVTYGTFTKTLTCRIVEPQETFTYEEDFDDIPNGSLPEGWTIKGNATASVQDGTLLVKGENWYNPDFVLFDLEKVQRQGLVMECDMTRTQTAAPAATATNAHAGLVYLYDDNFETSASYGGDVRYTALYTDKAATETQQGLSSDFGFRWNGVTKGQFKNTEEALMGAMAKKETVHLKIELGEDDRLPTVYVNGYEAVYTDNSGFTAQAVNEGKLGLAVSGACEVIFDNIKISGSRAAEITYDAEFVGGTTVFTSEDEAVAAVRVYEKQGDQTTDITAQASIQPQTGEDGTCTITVTYGDFTEILTCRIEVPEVEGFVYEENFDNVSDGGLPEGWTLISTDAGSPATAAVQDGKLVVSSGNWWNPDFILFDLDDVQRKGLVMECDMTRTDTVPGQPNNAHAGLVYYYDDETFAAGNSDSYGRDVRYTALYTDRGLTETQQGITSDFDLRWNEVTDGRFKNNEEALYGAMAKKETVHLKIVLGEDDELPTVYVNGYEAVYNNKKTFTAQAVNAGKLGLAVSGACEVIFDNIKISGSRAEEAAVGGIAAAKTVNEAGIPQITVDAYAGASDIEDGMLLVAAYEKDTGKLAYVSDMKEWNAAQYPAYHTTISLDGFSEYAEDAYTFKVMAMDQTSLKPICMYAAV